MEHIFLPEAQKYSPAVNYQNSYKKDT